MRRRTYTFTVVGDQCSRFGGGLWHGFYVRHILLTGIHTSHRYTYFSQVYILLTGIHTSHRYTYRNESNSSWKIFYVFNNEVQA